MFKNYLISALRFLQRNKLLTGINLLGLSLALAASFIILLFVMEQLKEKFKDENVETNWRSNFW